MRIDFRQLLWVIWLNLQIGEEQGLPAGSVTAAVRLDCDENGINLRQSLGIVEFQYPAFLRGIVHIKDPQIERLLRVRPAASPGLKRSGIFEP